VDHLLLIVVLVVLHRCDVIGPFETRISPFGTRADRDVIDLDDRVVFEVIDGVNTPAAALLDGSPRLVFLLLPLLGVAQPSRWRWWAEVCRTIPAPRSRRKSAPRWSRRKAAASATKAATWRTRTTEATWARAAESACAWRPCRWTIFACPSFADGQVASLERLGVELPDDFVSERAVGKLDKSEAARAAGFPVHGHDDVGRFRDGCEVSSKISFSRAVRQVSDEQTDCQGSSWKGFDSNSEGQAALHVR